jgi:guanylate kinase
MERIITVSAVSGAGKDLFVGNILKRFASFHFSESETTKELKERDFNSNKKYTQISKKDFKKKIEDNYFLEWGENHNNYYGTPRSSLQTAFESKKRSTFRS